MERTSAKGNRFAFVQCSDQSGAFELTVFSEVLSAKRNLLEPGQAVLISVDGRLDGEQVKLMAQTVEKLEDAVANSAAGLRIVISDPTARSRRCASRSKASAAAGGSRWSCRWRRRRPRSRSPCPAPIRSPAACATSSACCRASPRWRRFEPPARPVRTAGRAQAPEARAGRGAAVVGLAAAAGAGAAGRDPARHLVVVLSRAGAASSTKASIRRRRSARRGSAAYAQIPLLRTVSLDRTFYAPITTVEYARYATQVPDHFSFVVKAPAMVCDAVMRDEEGRGKVPNPHFLDPAIAAREFVVPCLEGLGDEGGAAGLPGLAAAARAGRGSADADRAAGGVLRGAAPEARQASSRSMRWSCAMPSC